MGPASRPLGANNNVNTLPARVVANGPTGRHFKPFDHRRMNPMAEIQEDPYASQQQQIQSSNPNPTSNPYHGTNEPIYSSGRSSSASSNGG